MLKIENVSAGYGDLKVLYNVSLTVNDGEVVSLVGSNGAGKTTLLRILSGFVPITTGKIEYNGKDLCSIKTFNKINQGISHIPQGRGIFGTLTIYENLLTGTFSKKYRHLFNKNLDSSYKMFPKLYERRNQLAGSLSGGEQQMLAIARALMINPSLLMLDEPSLGLAPIIVKDMFNIIETVAKTGVSILLVEQNLKQALSIADRGYVLETGNIVMEGNAKELLADKNIKEAYLGI